MDVIDRANIQPPGWLIRNDQLRVIRQLSAQDELLDVAARKCAGCLLDAAATHVKLTDDGLRMLSHLAKIQYLQPARAAGPAAIAQIAVAMGNRVLSQT